LVLGQSGGVGNKHHKSKDCRECNEGSHQHGERRTGAQL
jgi:hypothetical protein